MKKKNYHLFIVALSYALPSCLFPRTLRKTPCCWPSHTITLKHYMYIQSDDISGVEGHELVWLQSDR